MPKKPAETSEPVRHDLTGHDAGTSSASASHLAVEHPLESAKRETWSDWARRIDPNYDEDHEHYVTITELIEDLNGLFQFRNAEINPSTIRYWQSQGLIPYPVKRRHDGATRALYPFPLAFRIMLALRSKQLDRGYTLQHLRDSMHELLSDQVATRHDPSRYNLEPSILAVARQRAIVTGRPVDHVDVTFVDDRQGSQTYRYEIPTESE